MGHGGKRPGAGRKRGGLTRKTTEIAQRAVAEGITPLEVMLDAMRRHYRAKRYDEAAAAAKDAAPYMHPRLSSVQVQAVSDEQLDAEIKRLLADLGGRGQAPADNSAPAANGAH